MGVVEGYDDETTLNEVDSSKNVLLKRNRPGTSIKVTLFVMHHHRIYPFKKEVLKYSLIEKDLKKIGSAGTKFLSNF
jgi:hypothetical protein